ncbi:MAG: alpha-hydroxy acid oxidase [Paracoccaceae bacterium]|nr:alpha-hydroxy acid oxidase [Paracoccaceae bacterium]
MTIHCFEDARRGARRRLPWMVFDYIDGAAGDGQGEASNRQTLRDIRLMPRVLNNVMQRSVAVNLFDQQCELPFGVAPMGMCRLANPVADRALAEMAARHKVPVGVSTVSSSSLEDMAKWSEGQAWFQLYCSGNQGGIDPLLARCKAAGYETLVVTVDVPEVGRRPRELRRGFKMPFKMGPSQFFDFACHPRWSLGTLAKGAPKLANFGGVHGEFDRTASRAGADWTLLSEIREKWQGRLVVKGVLNVEDAKKLVSVGVDAIQVSSHGGRQLNSSLDAITALRDIRAALGPDFPLFYDSGIQSGEDVAKAYALGADFVFLGRVLSFALAADGRRGLHQMVDVLHRETDITLAQLGVTSMDALGQSNLA